MGIGETGNKLWAPTTSGLCSSFNCIVSRLSRGLAGTTLVAGSNVLQDHAGEGVGISLGH